MAPSKAPTAWDDEDSDTSEPGSPQAAPVARRGKFDDEEDSDVLESWDAAEDSEEEREKAKKAAEAKAKADAEAKANHKTKSQRIEEKRQENMRRRQAELDESSDEEETEAERRARMRASEKEADLKNAEDLFAGIGVSNARGAKPVTVQSGEDPTDMVDLSKLKLFSPNNVQQFAQLRETLVPLITANSKKPQYVSFATELSKQLVKELSSDQVKKIASGLTTISNEKMAAEKAAEKGGKKTKAAKTKVALSANRDVAHKADVTNYDDGLDE